MPDEMTGSSVHATPGVRDEVAALRNAVEDLAHRVRLDAAPMDPTGEWTDPVDRTIVLREWRLNRHLAVRAGHVEGIPSIYLVDRYGDMLATDSVDDAFRLLSALQAALDHMRDDLSAHRARRTSGLAARSEDR